MKISRRKFMAAAPVVAGAVLGLKQTTFAQQLFKVPADASGDALAGMNWNSFLQFVNTEFTFNALGYRDVVLKLVDIVDTRPENRRTKTRGQECFMMIFTGSSRYPLKQGTYSVNHFNLGDFELFITEGAKGGKTESYVAVINRLLF